MLSMICVYAWHGGSSPPASNSWWEYPKMAICDGESGWKWWSTPNFFWVPYVWTNPRSDMENTSDVPKPLKNRLMAFRHPIHSDANIWVPIRARMIMLYIFIYTIYIYIYIYIYTRLYSIYTLSIISKKPIISGDQSHDEKKFIVHTSASISYNKLPICCLCIYIYIYIS